MSAIFGFLPHARDANGAAALDTVLRSMRDATRPNPAHVATDLVSDDIAMGAQGIDGDVGVSYSDASAIAVIGDIAEVQALYDALPDDVRPSPMPSLPEILRLRFEHMGVDGLCQLNGMYALAAWDAKERKLYLVTDRMGFRKLAFWRGPEGVYFSTRYSAFTHRPEFKKKLDPLTIYEFLRYGYALSDGTFYEDVQRVPQGTLITCANGQIENHRYWNYAFDTSDMDHGDCVDELANRVRTAVGRRADGKVAAQITGGLDSRFIVGYLRELAPDADVLAATIGNPRAVDVMYGRMLARDLGYDHQAFDIDDSTFADHAEESVWRTEGALINHTCWRLAINDWIVENNRTRTTHGFMSIFPRMQPDIRQLIENPGREKALEVIRHQLHDMSDEIDLSKLFRPEVYDAIRQEPDALVERLYDEAPSDLDVHRYDYLELRLRQRNFQAMTLEHFHPITRMMAPLTDNDVVDFAGRMPVTSRANSRAYHEAIVKNLPRTCRAPHSKTNMPLNPSGLEEWYYRVKGRLQYHVLPKLGPLYKAPMSTYVPYREALSTGSRDFMLGCLDHAEGFEDIFDVGYMRRVVEEYADGKRPGYGPAYTLNTLLLWHKHFG